MEVHFATHYYETFDGIRLESFNYNEIHGFLAATLMEPKEVTGVFLDPQQIKPK